VGDRYPVERIFPRVAIFPRVTLVVLTGNIRLVDAPGNVLVPAKASGLPRDSVANVSQIITID
jgi:mRNA-degrading endonuclease toxin of MazEF toxin-antitoxin module